MKWLRIVGLWWGLAGFSLLIGSAIFRLLPHALESIRSGLSLLQWAALFLWAVFMLVSEGYRGFQKQFAPRFAKRANDLAASGSLVDVILAPLYCVGYYGAERRRIVVSWALTGGIIVLIVIVRQLAQPWRGIIDFGVVLGLVYGLIAVYLNSFVKRREAEA
ncbi:hypothetical protein BH09PAT4_BH09PAT4_02480 [soil metagenome]